MENLLYLTALGSILTLTLIFFKTFLIKRYGGSWYYYIWLLVWFSFCFPYKINILQYLNRVSQSNGYSLKSSAMIMPENLVSPILTESNLFSQGKLIANDVSPTFSLRKVLTLIYFTGVIILAAYYIYSYLMFLRKTKRNLQSVKNKSYIDCLFNVCYELSISKNIKLMQSQLVSTPMLIGILNPIIILPTQDFNINDLNMIFKHELTHYKRHDIMYKLLALVIHIVHWFNPISYLALKNTSEACEYSCDEVVTRQMDHNYKKAYGYMLLNQIETNNHHSAFSTKLSENNIDKNILKRRINIIMNKKKYRRIGITLMSTLVLVLCSNFFALKSINAENIIPNNTATEKEVQQDESQKTSQFAIASDYFSKTIATEEMETINEFISSSNNNSDIGTRNLTESEQNRIKILQNQYIYDILRPTHTLPLVSGEQEFYFDLNNQTYHYPETELTDDELLQLIDWRLKVNYVLSLQNVQAESDVTDSTELNKTQVLALANKNVETLFSVNTNNLQSEATYYEGSSIFPDGWFVRMYPRKINGNDLSDWNYAIWINSSTGDVQTERSSPTYKSTVINEDEKNSISKDTSWIEKATYTVVETQGETANISDAYLIEPVNGKEQTTVDINVVMENGSFYTVSLYYPDQSLKGLSYTSNKK